MTQIWWRRKLTNNPKPSNEFYYLNLKFQENWIKTEAVTMLSFFFRKIWRPWRHQLCQWVKTRTLESQVSKWSLVESFISFLATGKLVLDQSKCPIWMHISRQNNKTIYLFLRLCNFKFKDKLVLLSLPIFLQAFKVFIQP